MDISIIAILTVGIVGLVGCTTTMIYMIQQKLRGLKETCSHLEGAIVAVDILLTAHKEEKHG